GLEDLGVKWNVQITVRKNEVDDPAARQLLSSPGRGKDVVYVGDGPHHARVQDGVDPGISVENSRDAGNTDSGRPRHILDRALAAGGPSGDDILCALFPHDGRMISCRDGRFTVESPGRSGPVPSSRTEPGALPC